MFAVKIIILNPRNNRGIKVKDIWVWKAPLYYFVSTEKEGLDSKKWCTGFKTSGNFQTNAMWHNEMPKFVSRLKLLSKIKFWAWIVENKYFKPLIKEKIDEETK